MFNTNIIDITLGIRFLSIYGSEKIDTNFDSPTKVSLRSSFLLRQLVQS